MNRFSARSIAAPGRDFSLRGLIAVAMALLSLATAHAKTLDLTGMALNGDAMTTANNLTFSIDELSNPPSGAVTASIAAPGKFSDPSDFAMTVYRDHFRMSDSISFIIQDITTDASVGCAGAGASGEWIAINGIRNALSIGPQVYFNDYPALPVMDDTAINYPDIGNSASADADINSNPASNNPAYSTLDEPSPAAFCPCLRQQDTLEREPQEFAPRCVWEMASRLESPGFCEWRHDQPLDGTPAAGFCPWSRQQEALERRPLDVGPRCVRAPAPRVEDCGESCAADRCEMPIPCECEAAFDQKEEAGFCPSPRQQDALERGPLDFIQTITWRLETSHICEWRREKPLGGTPGFCPRRSQQIAPDNGFAGSISNAHRNCACATFGKSPKPASSEPESNIPATQFTPDNSPFLGTQAVGNFSFIDLGYFGSEFHFGFSAGAGAWNSVGKVSKFCTIAAARKVYSRFELQFKYDEAPPAPEPASWALMLVGLVGLMGLGARRKMQGATR